MRIVLKFAALALLLAAAAFLVMAVPLYLGQYRIMKTWPSAEAQVLRGEIIRHATVDGEALYGARLIFVYQIDGQGYRAAYDFPHESTHRERKEKQLAKHPLGSREQIRYNPADPSDIRISVGYNVDYFVVPVFVTGMGAICAVFAALLLLIVAHGSSTRVPARQSPAPHAISGTFSGKTG